MDFDFSRCLSPLRPIALCDLNHGPIEREWEFLYLFGDFDYAEGGGASAYIGIHRNTGEIYGLDVELTSSQLFLMNSDAQCFIETFRKADEMLRLPAVPSGTLSNALVKIDPEAFRKAESFWRLLSIHAEGVY